MSKQKTPVLAGAIPSFERMMIRLEKLSLWQPTLTPAIKAGLGVAYKYYKKMDDTNAYIVAMCESNIHFSARCYSRGLYSFHHPGIRMVWIQKNWGDEYIKKAKNILCDLVRVSLTCDLDVDTNGHDRW